MTDIAKLKTGVSKKTNSKDRCTLIQLNGSASPHVSSTVANTDSSVLPHIGQIWSSNHLSQLGEQLTDISNNSDIQLGESLLTR